MCFALFGNSSFTNGSKLILYLGKLHLSPAWEPVAELQDQLVEHLIVPPTGQGNTSGQENSSVRGPEWWIVNSQNQFKPVSVS